MEQAALRTHPKTKGKPWKSGVGVFRGSGFSEKRALKALLQSTHGVGHFQVQEGNVFAPD
jgi:hypothetical protein